MKELFGFDDVKKNILDFFVNNKLHHCNLINGIKGIGKSLFTLNITSYILSERSNICRKDITELEANRTYKLIENKSHPDLLILDINTIDCNGKENNSKKGEINVDQVRRVIENIKLTPSMSKNKVLIIDSIDNINLNGQNALLKTLEEPTSNTFVFMICHNMQKVLDTIKSRSNIINISNLKFEDWINAILTIPEVQETTLTNDEFEDLYDLSNYSISNALIIIKNNAFSLYDDICKNILEKNIISIQKLTTNIDNQESFEIFNIFIEKIFQNTIEYYYSNNKSNFIMKRKEFFDNFLKSNTIQKILDKFDYSKKILNNINIYNLDKKHCINTILTNI